ncbi:MAG: hypothetical protein PHX09_03670 [Clostridia bacterium]|nr:hypothetical protein [Clostridia bacterium]
MDKNDCETYSDEIDLDSLNKNGNAILKRRYIKDGEYLTQLTNSLIVAEGITAFLFSNTYGDGLQLPPLTNNTTDNFDENEYFQKYFEIRRRFYLQKEKVKPNSVHKNLDKKFIFTHYKQEKSFYLKYKDYFESISDKKEKYNKEKFAKSYLKWIKNKRDPLSFLNRLEVLFWCLWCFMIIGLIILEFFFGNSEWNFINKKFQDSDELQKQIIIYLILAFIASFLGAFARIKKILKQHRI